MHKQFAMIFTIIRKGFMMIYDFIIYSDFNTKQASFDRLNMQGNTQPKMLWRFSLNFPTQICDF